MKKLLSVLLVIVLLLMAIGPINAQMVEGSTYYGAWPYQVPPTGHFNTFAAGAMNFGIYQDLQEPPIAVLLWAQGVYEGMAAESFGYDTDGNYVVTLRDGVTWSDGSALSADDLMTTFNLFRLRGDAVWSNLTGIEKVDNSTVKLSLGVPSILTERLILTTNLRPNSVYGDLGNRAAALVADGMTRDDQAWKDLLTELTEFRPATYVSGGPYVLDPASVTEANVTMNHNPGGLNADLVRFETVVLWNGETEVVTPLVANEEAHYITHGIPPTTEQAFTNQGIDIIRVAMNTGPGLYFNHTVYPLNRPEVRQAIAYIIDREQNGFVSLGESGVGVELMTGMSDGVASLWLSDETIDSLNTYAHDWDKAAELLESIGFSKGDDGKWVDDQGNPLAFELTFPQEFADWSAAAENATQQLNDFGFQITARGVNFQQHPQDVYAGNFQIAVRDWGAGSPIPAQQYLTPYNTYNGQGALAGEAGAGMGFDPNITFSGGTFNAYDATNSSAQGTDVDAQRALVDELAVSYNELLPVVPLWERYTNNALNRRFLDAPPSDDPIYQNYSSADAWMPYLIMTGGIGPAN